MVRTDIVVDCRRNQTLCSASSGGKEAAYVLRGDINLFRMNKINAGMVACAEMLCVRGERLMIFAVISVCHNEAGVL